MASGLALGFTIGSHGAQTDLMGCGRSSQDIPVKLMGNRMDFRVIFGIPWHLAWYPMDPMENSRGKSHGIPWR